jgi:nitronate monooxygenase
VTRRRLPDTAVPIVAAPMAGGPTTVALCSAVAEAGGLPFLPCGYRTTQACADDIEALRRTGHPFGVNLFVPDTGVPDTGVPDTGVPDTGVPDTGVPDGGVPGAPAPRKADPDEAAFAAYRQQLLPEAEALGVVLEEKPRNDRDEWEQKVELLLQSPVPVVSLTFGLPDPAVIAALQEAGSVVLATVTTPAEAQLAQEADVDGLIVQGSAAGGHSATFDPDRALPDTPTVQLVHDVLKVSSLPVIAAGGVDGPQAVKSLSAAGAHSVAIGTLLLRTDEAGTSATHREALTAPQFTTTRITRAFTGRPARALRNEFIDRHESAAPSAYPSIHHLTRPLRQAAAAAGDAQRLHLWAGTGCRHAPAAPAGEVIRWLSTGILAAGRPR